MYTQQELEQHLTRFTEAWLQYLGSYDKPEEQLLHLKALHRCNRELDWFGEHNLALYRDIEWEPKLHAFVLVSGTTRPRTIYVGSPVSLFDTPEYSQVQDLVSRMYPQDRLIFAKGLYRDSNEWLAKWPAICQEVDMLLFFTDTAGWIGKGIYTELCDIEKQGKPMYFMELDGTQHELSSIPVDIDFSTSIVNGIVFEFNCSSWRQYVHITVKASEHYVKEM